MADALVDLQPELRSVDDHRCRRTGHHGAVEQLHRLARHSRRLAHDVVLEESFVARCMELAAEAVGKAAHLEIVAADRVGLDPPAALGDHLVDPCAFRAGEVLVLAPGVEERAAVGHRRRVGHRLVGLQQPFELVLHGDLKRILLHRGAELALHRFGFAPLLGIAPRGARGLGDAHRLLGDQRGLGGGGFAA